VVTSFTVNPSNPAAGQPATVTVVVANQGQSPAGPFWADFYINPSTPPAAPNRPWNDPGMCTLTPCFGIAWYVASGLGVGQSIVLTSDASSYYDPNTVWEGYFVSGSNDLYVFVDSWNCDPQRTACVSTGAVLESNEANNRAERHNLGVAGPNPRNALSVPGPESLPIRPANPDE